MNTIYIITQIDDYLMYEITDEYPVQLTLGDVQQYVDTLNSNEDSIKYGDFENYKTLPKYSYKALKTNINFNLTLNSINVEEKQTRVAI